MRRLNPYIRSSANYRTKQNGNYDNPTTWEAQGPNGIWYAASYSPEIGNPISITHAIALTKNEDCYTVNIGIGGSITYNGFSLNASGAVTTIDDVFVGFQGIQYATAPITAVGIPTPSLSVTNWRWELRKTEDKSLAGLSFDQNPSFPNVPIGIYDLKLTAFNSTDSWIIPYEGCIKVFPQRLTESICDLVIDVSTLVNGFYNDYTLGATLPGYKIGLKGQGTAFFEPYGIQGTLSQPVVAQVLDDAELITPTGIPTDVKFICPTNPAFPHTFRLDGPVKHLWINGSHADGSIGLFLEGTTSNCLQTVMLRDGAFTNVEFWKMDLKASIAVFAAAFSFIPPVSATYNATNYQVRDIHVGYCKVHQSGDEGVYMGYNNNNPQGGYTPPTFMNCSVAWNEFTDCGRDGIQPGGCINFRCNNNYINGYGKHGVLFQESAISWNGGTSGRCHSNFSTNGKQWLNIQSGTINFNAFASGSTNPVTAGNDLLDSYFYNNIHIAGTQTGLGSPEPFAAYAQWSNNTGAGIGKLNYHVYNNTVVCDTNQKFMEARWDTNCFQSDSIHIDNNLIIKGADTGGTSPEFNISGGGVKPTAGQYHIQNKVRQHGAQGDILFTDYANKDLTISSFSSPVYDGTAYDIITALSGILGDTFYDYAGFPMKAGANPLVYGAYSGYQKRTVAYVPPDPNPATFTTPINISGIQAFQATLGFEANKVGILYYVASTVDVTPTISQILAGTGFAKSGSVFDNGVAGTSVMTALSEFTNYYVFAFFRTLDNVDTSVIRVPFQTIHDIIVPVLSNFRVLDTERDKVHFTSSKPSTVATNYAHVTISGKTIIGVNIVLGQTDGYFLLSTSYVYGTSSNITYTGGDNIRDTALTPNYVAPFGPTAINNQILSEEGVNWTNLQNASVGGGDITTTSNSAGGGRSTQKIPSTSDGYVKFTYDVLTLAASGKIRFGMIADGTTLTYSMSNFIAAIELLGNTNTDYYIAASYSGSRGGIQNIGEQYRLRVTRPGNHVFFDFSPDGVSWTQQADLGVIGAGDIRACMISAQTGLKIKNPRIQAANGLI